MANCEISVRGTHPPYGYPMSKMEVGDTGILTVVPEGHGVQPGEPVIRTHNEFYFLLARMWTMLSSTDGYYVRNLDKEEQIVIRGNAK